MAIGAIVSPVKDKLEFEVLAWTPSTDGTVKAKAFNLITPDAADEGRARNLSGERQGQRARTPSCSSAAPGRSRSTSSRRPSARRTKWCGAATTARRAAVAARGAADGAAVMRRRRAKARCRPTTSTCALNEFLLSSEGQAADQRRRARARPDSRLPEQHLRHRQGRPDRRHAQRRLRPHRAHPRRRHAGRAAVHDRQQDLSRRARPPTTRSRRSPGSDKKNEVVMLGGHLDSWHSATGATDNAIGCAVMMEAARILKAIGVQPRRTIRVALWSGEEQGLLGSQAYVKEHFGSFEAQKPEYAEARRLPEHRLRHRPRARRRRVRPARRPRRIVRELLKPFEDIGVMGASASSSRATGGTDSHVVQQRRPPRHRLQPGPDRVQQPHVAHQPRHLRAHHRAGREAVGDDDRVGRLSPRDARRDAAALPAAEMPPLPQGRGGDEGGTDGAGSRLRASSGVKVSARASRTQVRAGFA